MEKIKFSLATAIAAMLILFTSCLGDKDNESNGAGYGLIAQNSSSGRYLLYDIDKYYGLPVYSETIQNYAPQYLGMEDAKFIGVSYNINYDDEANSGYGSRGYTIGTIDIRDADIKTGNRVYTRYEPIDEEIAAEDEVKPSAITTHSAFSTYLLMEASITNHYKDDEVEYYMEYYAEQEPGKQDGYNTYDIYVRLTNKLAETTEIRGTYSENRQFNLNNAISTFKSIERRQSSPADFYIQFKYVSDIDNGDPKFAVLGRMLTELSDN